MKLLELQKFCHPLQKVKINVSKKDSSTGEYLGGGTYKLYAADDIILSDGSYAVHKDEQIGEDLVLDETGKGTFE